MGIVAPTSQQTAPQPSAQQVAAQQSRIVLKEEEKPQQVTAAAVNGINGESGVKNAPNTCVVAPVIVKMSANEDEESDSDSNTTSKQKQRPIMADKPKVISLKKTGRFFENIFKPRDNNFFILFEIEAEQPALKIGVKSLEEIRKEKALKSQGVAEAPQAQPAQTESAPIAKPVAIRKIILKSLRLIWYLF